LVSIDRTSDSRNVFRDRQVRWYLEGGIVHVLIVLEVRTPIFDFSAWTFTYTSNCPILTLSMWATNKQKSGFTIVELLIVIVVIAILAAISIVAYNGIQSRARASAASAALSQAQKKILVAMNDGTISAYPTNQAGFDALGISSSGVTYQYIVPSSNPTGYCLTATAGNVSWKITESGQPTKDACNGHGSGGVAAITNLVANPSFETNMADWTENSGRPSARNTTWGQSGTASALVYNNTAGVYNLNFRQVASTPALPGRTYVASAYVRDYNGTAGVTIRIEWLTSSSTISTITSSPVVPSSSASSRISIAGVSPATTANMRIWIGAPATPAGSGVYIDNVMLTDGTATYEYADGSSPNWDWMGTVNNSTSAGPPL